MNLGKGTLPPQITSTMTKRLSYLILMLLLMSCEKDRIETITVKIEGKPVNLVYVYHLSRGKLEWSYEGEIEGKVGVCISGCETILEDGFTATCPKTQTLSGKFNIAKPYIGADEGINAGRIRCFVFVPEKDSQGEIRITFTESPGGGD